MKNLTSKYGPWALVTGASGGMGKEYAMQLAKQGFNIVAVARNQEKLNTLSKSIGFESEVKVITITADLTLTDDLHRILQETEDLEIGLLVNNAGREDSDHFLNIPIEHHLNTVDLNIKAPLMLTHFFGKKMKKRGRGGIIAMSSIVAFQGVPYIANYAGTKAYDLVFFEGIAAEFGKHNVDVLVAAPGFTDTELASVYNFSGTPMKAMPPAYVVNQVIKKLGKRRLSIPGGINQFLFWSGKYLFPRRIGSKNFGKVFSKVLRHRLSPTIS